jgi:hypothetical protein
MLANSTAMYPAPSTSRDSGTSRSASTSLEVIARSRPGKAAAEGAPPVAIRIRGARQARPATSTLFAPASRACPAASSTPEPSSIWR